MNYIQAEPLVSLTGVNKSYGRKVILRNIGADTNPFIIYNISRVGMLQGQTVAIVGESGSGKSTLFKIIAGILRPTSGMVTIPNPGVPNSYREVKGGDIGFVQQTYPLSRNQTVRSMLRDAARQGGLKGSQVDETVNLYLDAWGLTMQANLSRSQLSGGQRQRVAIIEQILCSHHFIIFDEPFSGLDVRNIEDVKESFAKITTTSELNTVIFSTHDIHLAIELSDLVVVLGYEKDEHGNRIPGGTIVKTFDLKAMGLAWQSYSPAHREVATEVQNIIKNG